MSQANDNAPESNPLVRTASFPPNHRQACMAGWSECLSLCSLAQAGWLLSSPPLTVAPGSLCEGRRVPLKTGTSPLSGLFQDPALRCRSELRDAHCSAGQESNRLPRPLLPPLVLYGGWVAPPPAPPFGVQKLPKSRSHCHWLLPL